MRLRQRKNRRPSDAERTAAAERKAEALAARGNITGARAALRRAKEIALAAKLAKDAHARLPIHPVYARQLELLRNAKARRFGLWQMVRPVPPHPTRREEALAARTRSR